MKIFRKRLTCPHCGRCDVHIRVVNPINHLYHLFLSCLTGGLWFFVYFALMLGLYNYDAPRHTYLCGLCGHSSRFDYEVLGIMPPPHVWLWRKLKALCQRD